MARANRSSKAVAANLIGRPDGRPRLVRVVGDVRVGRLDGHHVRVNRRVQMERREHAHPTVTPAVLRAKRAA